MNAFRIVVLALVGWLLAVVPLSAQDPPAADTLPSVADTVPAADTLPVGPPHSPTGAFFRSLVLPGWGQAWVGAPGRGSVYFALSAGSLWMLYKSRHKLDQAREQEAWLRQIGELEDGERTGLAESRARQVEDWLALSIFLSFFAGADAFVSAYLADFDEHVGIGRDVEGGLRIEASIPIGAPR